MLPQRYFISDLNPLLPSGVFTTPLGAVTYNGERPTQIIGHPTRGPTHNTTITSISEFINSIQHGGRRWPHTLEGWMQGGGEWVLLGGVRAPYLRILLRRVQPSHRCVEPTHQQVFYRSNAFSDKGNEARRARQPPANIHRSNKIRILKHSLRLILRAPTGVGRGSAKSRHIVSDADGEVTKPAHALAIQGGRIARGRFATIPPYEKCHAGRGGALAFDHAPA